MLGTLFLSLSLTGCVRDSTPKAPQLIYISPPLSLMTPCSKPVLRGDTWADLVEHAIKLSDELTVCNERILAIKRYVSIQEEITRQTGSDKGSNRDRGSPPGGGPRDHGGSGKHR